MPDVAPAHEPERSRRTPVVARAVLACLAAALSVALAACGGSGSPQAANAGTGTGGEPGTLTIAEPVHGIGYLPLYVGIREGFFEDAGLTVETVTLQGGGAHTNAVLNGEAWGFIGGPEHNAFAQNRGGDSVVIKSIANIVNRGNNYLVAPPGEELTGDLGDYLDGKTIVTGAYGGTPNSITRYILAQESLAEGDVRLIESADASAVLSIVRQGRADVAVVSEPILGQGIDEGIWGEPLYNVPEELGPYAYSTLNIRQDSIESDPETVQAFTDALTQALEFTENEREATFEIAREEFPTLDEAVLRETLDRAYEDELWEFSGEVTPESVATALDVVRASGVLEDGSDPVQYEDIVDMTFVEAASSSGE